MGDFVWPATVRPKAVDLRLVSSTGVHESPLNGALQTIARGGANRWRLTFQLPNLTPAQHATALATLAQLRGQEHRLITRTYDEPNRGARTGSPVVNGGGQTGTSLAFSGGGASVAGWLRIGDLFSVGYEIKIVTADVTTNGSGAGTIFFEPRLRVSPANGAAIEVVNPRGRFMLASNVVEWSSRPGRWRDHAIELVEAVSG